MFGDLLKTTKQVQNRTEVPLQQCCCLRFKLARYPFARVERSDKIASNWASPIRNVFDDMLKMAWRVQNRATALLQQCCCQCFTQLHRPLNGLLPLRESPETL